MAEFCKACAEEMGFEPDFVGLTTMGDQMAGLYSVVLCETCGPTQVDMFGRCIYHDKTDESRCMGGLRQ